VLSQDMAKSVDQVQSMSKLINSDDITGVFSSKKQVYYALTDEFQQIPSSYVPSKT
jgi:hypothetical protein